MGFKVFNSKTGTYIHAETVEEAKQIRSDLVRQFMEDVVFSYPCVQEIIDEDGHATWKNFDLGSEQIEEDMIRGIIKTKVNEHIAGMTFDAGVIREVLLEEGLIK